MEQLDALDPNSWASNEVLVFAAPSLDGAFVAFGKAEGRAHDAAIHVLEVDGAAAPGPPPRGTHHASVAWLPDASGLFYAARPAPGEVPAGEEPLWNAIYEHRLGSDVPVRRVFGDEHRKDYWCTVKVTECGRFAVLMKWDYVHANDVTLLRLADDSHLPVATGMASLQQVQVAGESLLIHTDRDVPRGRLCTAPLRLPRSGGRSSPRASIPSRRSRASVAGATPATRARRLITCASTPRMGRGCAT